MQFVGTLRRNIKTPPFAQDQAGNSIRIDETSSLAQDVVTRQTEAMSYSVLGSIVVGEGTNEGVMTAVGYFEKQRDIRKAIGWTDGVIAEESNIAFAMYKCEGGADIRVYEKLKCCRDLYELCAKQFGQANTMTIDAGVKPQAMG